MKKKHFLVRTSACVILSASLTVSSFSVPADGTASAADSTGSQTTADTKGLSLSQADVIHLVADDTEDSLLHYHYENEDGETVNLTGSSSASSYSFKRASSIPSSYDLRDYGAVTEIKDQGVTGACWAFATIKSIESNLLLQSGSAAADLDLSESHLVWYSYHPSTDTSDVLYSEGASLSSSASSNFPFFRGPHDNNSASTSNTLAYEYGGSSIITMFALARWSGAVDETLAAFSGGTEAEMSAMADSMDALGNTLQYSATYKLSDAICYDEADISEIKTAIMENGAISVAYYCDTTYDHTASDGSLAYYQERYTGDYAISAANHAVTIVGWDDSYSKNNFGTYKPSSDGAWLIAGSYGTEYGQDGYYWISYEEPSLTEYYSFLTVSEDTYDNNYQYDGFGYGNAIAWQNSTTATGANIFTADTDYRQSLDAVGFYTISDNQSYTIEVYKDVTAGSPVSGTLAASFSGTAEYNGYHTVTLPEAVSLDAGETFSVVISYERTGSSDGYLPFEGESYRSSELTITYNSNSGESFLYAQTEDSSGNDREWGWVDLNDFGDYYNNICLKAYTTDGEVPSAVDDSTGTSDSQTDTTNTAETAVIAFSASGVTLGKGETYKLKSTVVGAADSSVVYESSDSNIATVTKKGKVTANGVGTAVITACLSSGESASFLVTVKKAPSKITATPTKKTLKKGKSFTIKTALSQNSASNKITYTSSDTSVVKVTAKGKVKALKKGTAVVTIKTYNGKKAKVRVTVK